jgi:hypothetical protein
MILRKEREGKGLKYTFQQVCTVVSLEEVGAMAPSWSLNIRANSRDTPRRVENLEVWTRLVCGFLV